jgi:hypothetical protein
MGALFELLNNGCPTPSQLREASRSVDVELLGADREDVAKAIRSFAAAGDRASRWPNEEALAVARAGFLRETHACRPSLRYAIGPLDERLACVFNRHTEAVVRKVDHHAHVASL